MLGTRTKQVNSYGRRSCRIVNASDRRDQDSLANSSDVDIPPPLRSLKRENAIIISPAKPRVGHRRLKGPRSSPLAQNRPVQLKTAQDATMKRALSKVDSIAPIRQPLTPLRVNGGYVSSSGAKGKSKASSSIRPTRTSLKLRTQIVAVDILLLDETGNVLTQERRLSHTNIQADQVCDTTGKGKKIKKALPSSPPPIAISDDSDEEVVPPIPVTKRLNRKPRAIVISSDESEGDDKGTLQEIPPVPPAKSYPRRVEVVIPPVPSLKQITRNPPGLPQLSLTPPKPSLLRVALPALLAPPLPTEKPRQLTPIRGSSSRSIFRRPPPTPSTPTDADLSFDLAQLDLYDATEINDIPFVQPEYLVPLLNECSQASPYEFSAFIESFPFDPIIQSSAEDKDAKFRKIGEASYSEVFGIGDVVLKIIPVRSQEEPMTSQAGEMPAPSDAEDVLKEIIVTREIGEICDGFVKLLKTYVVKGRYPSLLLDLWDEYNLRKGSESIRPDSFGLTQVYLIIILPNGGPDLESFTFKNISKSGWHQACGIFWQVARALEQAERLVSFEHRDLHWGQILVKNIPVKKSTRKCSASGPLILMDDPRFGVQVTIIDLGLSRMDAMGAQGIKTYWTPFDSEIFEGEGDYQYDVYRAMKNIIRGAWKSYHPFTNVMWLHYLVTKLLREKRLKLPSGKSGGDNQVASPSGYDEGECYDCLAEIEKLLGNCIASAMKGQKARRKTVVASDGPKSASDVIAYGVRRGWVR